MDIKIREATPNDYRSLCEIYAELDEYHRLNHPELFIEPDGYARTEEYIAEIIHDSDRTLFVAEADSKIVGLAECYIQESSDFPVVKKRKWVQLDNISVKKEYQKHHIGSLLLGKVVGWAESKNIRRIELKVYSFNNNAIEFYSDKDFKELNRTMYLDV